LTAVVALVVPVPAEVKVVEVVAFWEATRELRMRRAAEKSMVVERGLKKRK